MDVPIRLDISPSAHPSMVQGSGPGSHTAREAMAGLYLAHGQLRDLSKTVKDKTQIGAAGIPHCEKAVSAAGAAQEMLTNQIVRLATEIAAEIKGTPPSSAAEIRAYWKSQKSTANLATMFHNAHLPENRDTIHAVLNGPNYLSGLKQDIFLMLKDQAAQSLCPEKHALIAETRAALKSLDRATEDFTDKTAAMLNRWASKDAAIIAETLNPGDAT